MNFEKLRPFLAKLGAELEVTPAEVYRQMQINKNEANTNVDEESEAVDQELVATSDKKQKAQQNFNLEGKIIEQTFPELAVEEAIDQVRDNKKQLGDETEVINSIKTASSCWELLTVKYGNNSR
jgi:hypothetical protein